MFIQNNKKKPKGLENQLVWNMVNNLIGMEQHGKMFGEKKQSVWKNQNDWKILLKSTLIIGKSLETPADEAVEPRQEPMTDDDQWRYPCSFFVAP